MEPKDLVSEVESIFVDCLGEAGDFFVEGIVHSAFINLEKVEKNRERLNAILKEMDPRFFSETGGGYTFLNLCIDKNGHLWSGSHLSQEKLIMVAIAAKQGKFLLDRKIWSVLPGGMPYVMFSLQPFSKAG